MEKSNMNQPREATASNILQDWCRYHKKNPAVLKEADVKRIIAHSVKIGIYIGGQKALDVIQGQGNGIAENTTESIGIS